MLQNVSDFVIDSFSGRQGLKNSEDAAIVLDNATDGIIRNSRAAQGTNTFIHVQGKSAKYVSLKYNETRKAKKEVTFDKVERREAFSMVK